jgi:hypothetical protein
VCDVHLPASTRSLRRRAQAFHHHRLPSETGESKVPVAVHAEGRPPAGPERPFAGAHRGDRRNEAQKSEIRLPAYRPAAHVYIRDRHR